MEMPHSRPRKASQPLPQSIPQLPRQFLGLALTEFWERFALAGVKSLLILLLIDHVLQPEADVLGLAWLRESTTVGSGPAVGDVGFASQIYGFTNALVYLCIPIGGLIGDLLISRRASVLTGGTCMISGLMLMISVQGFLPGLLLFAMGAGLLKGNLSTQFGTLFANEARRRRAFAYYLIFLNAGGVCGPLLMGAAAMAAGWQFALGLAAAGIVAGMLIYNALLLRGGAVGGVYEHPRALKRALKDAVGERVGAQEFPGTTPAGKFAFVRFVAAILAIYLCFAAYGQIGNIVLIWARERVDLDIAGWAMPVGWILALDGLFTIVLVFAVQAGFHTLARRGFVIGPLSQIVLGCLACAGGYCVLVLAEWLGGAVLSLAWVLVYLLLLDLAIVLVWPSGLSLATSLAPRGRAGLWVGMFYLHGFFASLWVGFAGGFFEAMGAAPFWLLNASIALAGAGIAALCLPRGRPSQIRQLPLQHGQSCG